MILILNLTQFEYLHTFTININKTNEKGRYRKYKYIDNYIAFIDDELYVLIASENRLLDIFIVTNEVENAIYNNAIYDDDIVYVKKLQTTDEIKQLAKSICFASKLKMG